MSRHFWKPIENGGESHMMHIAILLFVLNQGKGNESLRPKLLKCG